MNHIGWFETRQQMKYNVIYAEKAIIIKKIYLILNYLK